MRIDHRRSGIVLVGFVSLLFVSCGRDKATSSSALLSARLSSEIARVDAKLRTVEKSRVPNGLAPVVKASRESLERARVASTDELRLYRLRDAVVETEALAFLLEHPVKSVEELEALAKKSDSGPPAPSPMSILRMALMQGANNRAARLRAAAVPFAKISAPGDGVYYLAESEGNRRFAAFIRSLPAEAAENPPSHEAVRRGLQRVDDETLRTFGSDPAASKMIPVSAKLKEAHEQLDQKLDAAATLSLIEARMILSRQVESKQQLPSDVPSAARPGGSIGRLLTSLEKEKPESLVFIRRDVVPLYSSLFLPGAPISNRKPDVVVTLLRWPYT